MANRFTVAAVCALLVAAVALAFGQTVGHGFINYDDGDYVYENPHVVGGLTAQGMVWAFTRFHASNWHPLTWISHMADCEIHGLKYPGGHHLTNFLLHAATAILLFLALRRMTGDLWPSAFAATLFAVHPLRVESVAWVAERKDVLSGLFFALTLIAYAEYARRPFSLPRYLLAAGLFALGLMCKPMLVTLPFVLLLLDYWPLGRWRGTVSGEQHGRPTVIESVIEPERSDGGPALADPLRECPGELVRPYGCSRLPAPFWLVIEKIPLLAMSAAVCVVTSLAQGPSRSAIEHLPLSWRMGNAAVAYAAYLWQFLFPAGLAPFYPHPGVGLPMGKVAAASLVLMGISAGVLAWRRPYLLVGWLWYLGMLVPVIGLVQVGEQAMADRYTYLTQIGLYIAVAWGVSQVSRRWPSRGLLCGAAAVIVTVIMTVCAWRQTSYWRDSETLWTRALACAPASATANSNLALALADRGETEAAIDHYRKALEIDPDYPEAHNNLGIVLAGRGQADEAIAHFRKVLEIEPGFAEAHYNLALSLVSRGRVDEAIAHYRKALEIEPERATIYFSLGNALVVRGNVDGAVAQYQKALEIDPDYAEAHYNLGAVLASRGEIDRAIAENRKALEIKPDYLSAHLNLARMLVEKGEIDAGIAQLRTALQLYPRSSAVETDLGRDLVLRGNVAEAAAHFQKAIEIDPKNSGACYQLGLLFMRLGRPAEAAAALEQSLKIDPNSAVALNNLANILCSFRRYDEAAAGYRRAIEIDPNYAEAHNNLGLLLDAMGQRAEAGRHFRTAVQINPRYAQAHNNLGVLLMTQGQASEAVEHFRRAVDLDPKFDLPHANLGRALGRLGQNAAAAAELRVFLRLRPDQPQVLAWLAWVLATAPQDKVRAGKEAVELAQRAVAQQKADVPQFLDALAAAYAENGQFREAAETARRAKRAAAEGKNQALCDAIDARLRLYEAGKPYREVVQK